MPKCKFCGTPTKQENAVCEECRYLFEYIRRDNLEDRGSGFQPEVCDGWRMQAFLCYIPLFFWIPYLLFTRSAYVRFHANQGLIFSILTALCVAAGIGGFALCGLGTVWGDTVGYLVVQICMVVWGLYFIWGLVSALSGSGSVLPLIGKRRILH